MALLYVTELEALTATSDGGNAQIAQMPPIIDQAPIAIGETSVQSAAFAATTKFVRIATDVPCSITFGTSPTATQTNMRMSADTVEYFGVAPGFRVAVIINA